MSDFERWWEANWKKICGPHFYFASEKTLAEHGWNAAIEKAEAERDAAIMGWDEDIVRWRERAAASWKEGKP